jgi:hypothetical protein
VTITIDGKIHPLPTLKHSAGNLDAVFWVGGNGLALVEFGTHGEYHSWPWGQRPDDKPTIAIVDALHGNVLQAIPVPIPNYSKSKKGLHAIPEKWKQKAGLINMIDARIDQHGRIYAVFNNRVSQWFEWRQGNKLRELPIDLYEDTYPFSITPDLKNILVMHNLSGLETICENFGRTRYSCPPPEPVSGVIAELRNIATGRILWRIKGTAARSSKSQKPAISPDGRYAIINLPSDKKEQNLDTVALIAMRDGRIVQKLSSGDGALGFSDNGQIAWIGGPGYIATYWLNNAAHVQSKARPSAKR